SGGMVMTSPWFIDRREHYRKMALARSFFRTTRKGGGTPQEIDPVRCFHIARTLIGDKTQQVLRGEIGYDGLAHLRGRQKDIPAARAKPVEQPFQDLTADRHIDDQDLVFRQRRQYNLSPLPIEGMSQVHLAGLSRRVYFIQRFRIYR